MSNRSLILVLLSILILTLCGCQTIGHPNRISVAYTPEPPWLYKVPDASQGYVYFVGRSQGTANEKLSLEDARKDAASQALVYLGGFAKQDFEERRLSLNLSSATLDPTTGANNYQHFVNENFISLMLSKENYWEIRRTPGGDQYFSYVLMPFPINQSLKSFSAQQLEEAKQRVRDAQTDAAKKQAQDVVDFWEKTQSVFARTQ